MMTQQNFRQSSFIEGLAIKAPVKVATNAAVTLSGEQTVNSVVLTVGDRVLVKDQADPIENGIYVVESSAWQRAGDWDGERDVVGGSVVPAYRASDGVFVHYIVSGSGSSLSPGVDAMNFAVFYDPNAAGGATLPISTAENNSLRADNAGGWAESASFRITATGFEGNFFTMTDGANSVLFVVSGGDLLISGTLDRITINEELRLNGNFLYISEAAAASTDFVGLGQFWVRNDAPCVPMFTDDTGVDYQLNLAPSFSAPLVLLDDEEIQLGTSTDVVIKWDAAFGGLTFDPLAVDTPLAFRNGMQIRFYNDLDNGYIQFENTGVTGVNDLTMTKSGSASVVSYQIGAWDHTDNLFQRPLIDDYAIKHQTIGSTSGAMTIDFENGNSAYLALTENITSVTISNPPASGRLGQIEIEILQDSVARTITWPASVKWPGGTAPDLSTTNGTYLVHLRTRDGGTTYLGTYVENFS